MAASLLKALRRTHCTVYLASAIRRNPRVESLVSYFGLPQRKLSSSPSFSSSSTQSQVPERQGGRWSRWLLFLPGAVTFGLGTWQIFRRQQKVEMIEHRKKRLEMEPIALNSATQSERDFTSLEFRKVECEGVFDDSKSIYIGPRSRSISGVTENGYYVVTPLLLTSSQTDGMQLAVLVNRGWVPRSWKNKPLEDQKVRKNFASVTTQDDEERERSFWRRLLFKKSQTVRDEQPAAPPVKVIGVVRGSEKPSIFVPANDPSSGQWFYVDVSEIAHFTGFSKDTLYIEDVNDNINSTQPYPVPKDVDTLIHYSVMPQDHLNYTLTWYSLSAAVTFMAFERLNPKKSPR